MSQLRPIDIVPAPSSVEAAQTYPSEAPESGERSSRLPVAGVRLKSLFQPIFSLVHSGAVGHEALLRGTIAGVETGAAETLSCLAESLSASDLQEHCTRQHLERFAADGRDGWLFLNVSPEALGSSDNIAERFSTWLVEAGVPASSVVLEVVETKASAEAQLPPILQELRELGCRVAIDDFGAGESNFERIWRLRPDLVKIDRAMLEEACSHAHVRQLIPGIVSLLHEAGCLVVLEGVETREQALIALEADVDFVQGFYFSIPSSCPHDRVKVRETIESLTDTFRAEQASRNRRDETFHSLYSSAFSQCVRSFQSGAFLETATETLISMPGVQRLYLLDGAGRQVGKNLESASSYERDTMRFDPFVHSHGADWSRRPYFQRALSRPNVLQVSRPYLSVRDAQRCITMSMAALIEDDLRVICLDLDAESAPSSSGSRSRRRFARWG